MKEPRTLKLWSIGHLLFGKFNGRSLEQALRQRFGEKLFGESAKRLVIPSFNLAENDVHIFRTPHHSKLKRDWKVPAWKGVTDPIRKAQFLKHGVHRYPNRVICCLSLGEPLGGFHYKLVASIIDI